MRLHHLNCISTCPIGGRLIDGHGASVLRRGRLTCHCVLVETDDTLVLIDTGLGLRDVASPESRLSGFFLALVQPEFRERMTAVRQVQRMGFDPSDVRHIVLTHLDFDHAGGLDDFPQATVHLLGREREHAAIQQTWLDRQRFRPRQWSTQGNWVAYGGTEGEEWMGFGCVRDLRGLPPEILLVPLSGHTHGHAGVAVKTREGWHLLAGDAYFHHHEMDQRQPRCPPGLRFYQWMMEKDRRARLANQRRLRELRHRSSNQVEVFCSHDASEFERLADRSAQVPAKPMAAMVTRWPQPAAEAATRVAHAARTGKAIDRPLPGSHPPPQPLGHEIRP